MPGIAVEFELWTPPDDKGMVKLDQMKGRAEIGREILSALRANGHHGLTERADYCSPYTWAEADAKLPEPFGGALPESYWSRVAYAVPGGNEGWYVHVGVIDMDRRFWEILLIKTFEGWEHANALVAAINSVIH